jgi:hypothetical protein
LQSAIGKDLDTDEREIIGNRPFIGRIPRLDVVSRFVSQGAEKIGWFDFRKSGSEQQSVSEIMRNLVARVEKAIDNYAKV